MNYLARNEKMMKMSGPRTFNWGIPAFKSKDGFKTCPAAGACAQGCFARAGWYTHRPVVIDAYHRRLALARGPGFEDTICNEISLRRVQRLRIHDSGDFFSAEYLRSWIRIMSRCPSVQFYTYTKMVGLLKRYAVLGELPKNFSVVYSFGGLQDHLIDTKKDRHCVVFSSIEELRASGYENASEDDAVAAQGKNRKIGIVYHGQKGWGRTGWANAQERQAAG